MTIDNYMALDDFQELWTNKIKPAISQTYATKQEAGANFASVAEGKASIRELT